MEKTRLFVYVMNNEGTEKREFELDLDSSVTFSLTRQFTDLSNPTAIYNTWSKSVSIPFTKNNNMIFGMIFNPDRIVHTGNFYTDANGVIGTFNFNPSIKVPFKLFNNGCLIMCGYIKFLSVEKENEVKGKYNIVLNGEIGKIYQDLKKITFDNTLYSKGVFPINPNIDYYKYFIEGGQYVYENIDRNIVIDSWNANERDIVLRKRTDSDYRVTDIIGFAPNNSFNDNFDYTSMIGNESSKTIEIAEYLTNMWNKPSASADKFISPVDAKSLVGNGLSPRAFGEFRSYNQIPFIYWNQLFQIFCEWVPKATAENVTFSFIGEPTYHGGYTAELDDSWFNEQNPYWEKLVFLGKPISSSYITPFDNKYRKLATETLVYNEFGQLAIEPCSFDVYRTAKIYEGIPAEGSGTQEYPIRRQLFPMADSAITETTPMFTVGNKTPNGVEYDYFKTTNYKSIVISTSDIYVKPVFDMQEQAVYFNHGVAGRTRIHDNNALLLNFEVWQSEISYIYRPNPPYMPNSPIKTYKFAVVSDNTTVDVAQLESDGYTVLYRGSEDLFQTNDGYISNIGVSYIFDTIEQPLYTNGLKFIVSTAWLNTGVQTFITEYYTDNTFTAFREVIYKDTDKTEYVGTGSYMDLLDVNIRLYTNTQANTRYPFTLNSLWSNDYNLFDEILKYCKQFRIYIIADDIEKKLKFIPYYKYFTDGYDGGRGVLDWTDKVDYSKAWKLEPIIADSKYMLFNYEDGETAIAESYKASYQYNFGEKRIETPYNFDNKTNNILDGVKFPCVSTDTLLTMGNISGQYDSVTDKFSVSPKIAYDVFNEAFITTADKDGKYVDVFGQLYFDNGLKNFDNSFDGLYLTNPVYVTDDSLKEVSENVRVYNRLSTPSLNRQTRYRNLDIIDGNGNMLLYGVPKEKYTYGSETYNGAYGIYDLFWNKYMSDLYSLQNKKVTCYMRITPEDWEVFQFNKFVLIDNTLYVVNKIFDYSFNPSQSTKVELVSVNDVNNYTYVDLSYWYITPTVRTSLSDGEFRFEVKGNNIPQSIDEVRWDGIPDYWFYTYSYQYIDSHNAILTLDIDHDDRYEPITYNITATVVAGDVNKSVRINIILSSIIGD